MKDKIRVFFKKYGKRMLIIAAILIPLIVFANATITSSAFGDYNDYDYDNHHSSGSSSGGFSGGSTQIGSENPGDLIGILYVIFWVFIWTYNHFGCPGVIVLIILIIAFFLLWAKREGNKQRKFDEKHEHPARYIEDRKDDLSEDNMSYMQNQNTYLNPKVPDVPRPNRSSDIARIIATKDVLFTEPDFITYAKQVYMDIQYAWCKRDLAEVKAVLHSNLYERTQAQLEMKIRDKAVPHLERLTVEEAYMTAYRRDKEYEYVTVFLSSKMIEYQTDEETGSIIYGDRTTRWEIHYLMTFMRSTKVQTPEKGSASRAFNCPNCGGTMSGATTFGVCPYCGSSVKSGEYGWVLSDFGRADNDAPDEGIQILDY